MKNLTFTLVNLALLIALVYAIKATIDPQAWASFWQAMAGDYPLVWERHIAPVIPPLTHPIMQIIVAIILLGIIRNMLRRKQR